jgi:hypothetical protein
MTKPQEINLQLGQQGLIIETEQDPASTDPKALTNSPVGTLKHSLDIDYQGKANPQRRKGYQDAYHRPEDKTVELTVDALAAEPTVGDTITGNISGATMRVLSADAAANTIRGISTNALVFDDATPETISDAGLNNTMNPDPATISVGGANYAIDTYDTHCVFDAVTGEFADSDLTYNAIVTINTGVKGLDRYVYMDNRGTKTDTEFDVERYTVFAVKDDSQNFPLAHTYHWRNAATPNIHQLQTPVLDRSIYPAGFSDVNDTGFEAGAFWRYETWGRGGEGETYLLGTNGGQVAPPVAVTAPTAWNCGVAGTQPPVGSFDSPATDANAEQRRVLIWFPTWYEWWATINVYTVVPEVGLHNWFAPFIWYHVPYDADRNLKLTFFVMHTVPPVGAVLTQATSTASMTVTDWVQSENSICLGFANVATNATAGDIITQAVSGASMEVAYSSTTGNYVTGVDLKTGTWNIVNAHATTGTLVTVPAVDNPASVTYQKMTILFASLTVAPEMGDTLTHAGTGATMVVETADVVANTVTGYDLNTGAWANGQAVTSDDAGAAVFTPSPATTVTITYVTTEVYGGDMGTGDWTLTPTYLVSDGTATMDPANALLTAIEHIDYDQFYAEPCGMFIKKYKNSLFMARIERTELIGSGYQTPGTPTYKYEPSAFMWSFWGRATGMELGTPPEYPFAIPNEPDERVWGCAARGFKLNRHNYFKRGDGLAITGLETWNKSLYVMKPSGFGQIYGTYSGDMALIDLEMSQGPAGPFAWCKADEGIYYCTKKGLYLFDGNPGSQNICLSDGKVDKIFKNDIDYDSTVDALTGQTLAISMMWSKAESKVIISYPKRGEQGGSGTPDGLPSGTPTRVLNYDTRYQRFSESKYPLPIDSGYNNPCPGIMKAGEDPTDDTYTVFTHPIGNYLTGNADGRILFQADVGYRDNVTLDGSALPEALSGDRITYNITSKDHTLGRLKPKLSVTSVRQIVYCNNGGVMRRLTYNYYNENEEEELTFIATADGYYSEKRVDSCIVSTGTDTGLSTVAFTYYHDDDNHTALRITFASITTAPTVGDVLTQLNTAATLTVSSSDISTNQVWGQDGGTGTWDTVGANTVTGGSMVTAPSPAPPTALATVLNPDNTNPYDSAIQFVAVSAEVAGMEGDVKSSN